MEQKLTYKQYSEALKQDKLLGLKCLDCGAVTVPPKMVCRKCAGPNLDITEVKGEGKIRTYTTVYVPAEDRAAEAPYTIVIVELDAGPWLVGNLEDIDPKQADTALIGKRVKMGHKIVPGDRYAEKEVVRLIFSLTN